MFGLPIWLLGGAAAAVVALGALWWFDTGRIAAERDNALQQVAVVESERDQAVRAAHATEAAFASYRKLSLEQDARQTARLAEANRRAAKAGKTRQTVTTEGTNDPVGPGVAAAIRSRLRGRDAPASGGDGVSGHSAGSPGVGAAVP